MSINMYNENVWQLIQLQLKYKEILKLTNGHAIPILYQQRTALHQWTFSTAVTHSVTSKTLSRAKYASPGINWQKKPKLIYGDVYRVENGFFAS